jgi:GNAT superfamily N-acetyltransferase
LNEGARALQPLICQRTFSHRGALESGELSRLVRFDVRREVALVAVVRGERPDTYAAVARLTKSAAGDVFEFAIVVSDAWQRRGIGARLLGKLLEAARRVSRPTPPRLSRGSAGSARRRASRTTRW